MNKGISKAEKKQDSRVLEGERGTAGVKRIASLLHSMMWESVLVLNYLWKRGDESVLEKSKSLKAEELCAVRSTKAARLKRIKPGYFSPPTDRPIFVPGINWLQVLVTGIWRTCVGERRGVKKPTKNAKNKAKSSKKLGNYGAGKSFTYGIAALQVVPGQNWCWITPSFYPAVEQKLSFDRT